MHPDSSGEGEDICKSVFVVNGFFFHRRLHSMACHRMELPLAAPDAVIALFTARNGFFFTNTLNHIDMCGMEGTELYETAVMP